MRRAETLSFHLIYVVWLSCAHKSKTLVCILSTTKFKSQKFVSLTDNGNETATAVQRPRTARQNRKRSPKTNRLTWVRHLAVSRTCLFAYSLLLVLEPVFAHTQEFIDPPASRMIRTILTTATLRTVMLVLGPEQRVCKNRMGPERPTIRGGRSFANRLANREEAANGIGKMDLISSRTSQQSSERRESGELEGLILKETRDRSHHDFQRRGRSSPEGATKILPEHIARITL